MAEPRTSRVLRRAVAHAGKMASGTRPTGRVLRAAAVLLSDPRRSLGSVADDARSFVRLARAVLAKRYVEVSRRTVVAVLAALVYFVNPLDLVPDAIPLVGWLDDAAVLTWVASRVRDELDRFRMWEDGTRGVIDVESIAVRC